MPLRQCFLPIRRGQGDRYGEIRALLQRAGTPIGNNDLWIATHARALMTTLITNNTKEFARVPGLELGCW
jgi:tRNA(fMet)-specific endonuclease VapC